MRKEVTICEKNKHIYEGEVYRLYQWFLTEEKFPQGETFGISMGNFLAEEEHKLASKFIKFPSFWTFNCPSQLTAYMYTVWAGHSVLTAQIYVCFWCLFSQLWKLLSPEIMILLIYFSRWNSVNFCSPCWLRFACCTSSMNDRVIL